MKQNNCNFCGTEELLEDDDICQNCWNERIGEKEKRIKKEVDDG